MGEAVGASSFPKNRNSTYQSVPLWNFIFNAVEEKLEKIAPDPPTQQPQEQAGAVHSTTLRDPRTRVTRATILQQIRFYGFNEDSSASQNNVRSKY